jgi:hypothetical protein
MSEIPDVESDLQQLITELAEEWKTFNEVARDLNIEGVLLEHVKSERRFLVDRWLATISKIDRDFEEAADVIADLFGTL